MELGYRWFCTGDDQPFWLVLAAKSFRRLDRVANVALCDFFFPLETSQRPMYELLGTPEEHKRWVVYDGGHSVPRTQLIEETLGWLERYLGPVD